jgi:hypothetical protein
MNRHASILATVTPEYSQTQQDHHPVSLWALAVVLVAIAITALVLDAAMTTELRIALFVQSGMYS